MRLDWCVLALLTAVSLVAGCDGPDATSQRRGVTNLAIKAYNYTDTDIGHYEVDGAAGFDVVVSDEVNGGGKTACCFALTKENVGWPITVKWTRNNRIWCTQTVTMDPHIPRDADLLQVHFFRDGHIEINASNIITASSRLSIPRHSIASRHENPNDNLNNDAAFSVCKHGYK